MEDEENSGPGYDPIAEEFATCAHCTCDSSSKQQTCAEADSVPVVLQL